MREGVPGGGLSAMVELYLKWQRLEDKWFVSYGVTQQTVQRVGGWKGWGGEGLGARVDGRGGGAVGRR